MIAKTLQLKLGAPEWRTFVMTHPEATIFHHPAWTRLLAETYAFPCSVLAFQDGSQPDGSPRIVAGLPILDVHGVWGGKRRVSLPFSDHCAPLASSSISSVELAEQLAIGCNEKNDVPLEVRWPLPPTRRVWPSENGFIHTLDLRDSADRLFSRFSKMHQRNVRKAERGDVRIDLDRSLAGVQRFYALHLATRRRQGVPIQPWRFFRLLWERLIKTDLGFTLLAYHQDQCVAGAVFLGWNNVLVYKYGASDPAFTEHRPNHLLFWTAIKWATEHGYTTLDWGRTDSDNEGLRAFKSGWGTVEGPLIYSQIADHPTRESSGRFQRLIAPMIQKAPPQLCRAFGELLYRYAA